jgi:hypothetical protein
LHAFDELAMRRAAEYHGDMRGEHIVAIRENCLGSFSLVKME